MKHINYQDYNNSKEEIGYPVIIDYDKHQMLMIEKGIGIEVTGDTEDIIKNKYEEFKTRLVGGKRRKSRRNRKTKKGKKSRKARKSRRKSNRRR